MPQRPPPLTPELLAKLLSAVADDVVGAHTHFRLYRRLLLAVRRYTREINQSPAFWQLAISAQMEAALLRLGRLYDTDDRALSLPALVRLIGENRVLFHRSAFRQRLAANAFVTSLASVDRIPRRRQIAADLRTLSDRRPEVKRLLRLRHTVLAHRSLSRSLTASFALRGEDITFRDVDVLLTRAKKILNRYWSLFSATTQSTSLVGDHDYLFVLNSIRAALAQDEERYQRELAALGPLRPMTET